MELLLALAGIVVIVVWWCLFYLAAWIGHKLTIKALTRRYGTADPDALLAMVTERIRNGPKR